MRYALPYRRTLTRSGLPSSPLCVCLRLKRALAITQMQLSRCRECLLVHVRPRTHVFDRIVKERASVARLREGRVRACVRAGSELLNVILI